MVRTSSADGRGSAAASQTSPVKRGGSTPAPHLRRGTCRAAGGGEHAGAAVELAAGRAVRGGRRRLAGNALPSRTGTMLGAPGESGGRAGPARHYRATSARGRSAAQVVVGTASETRPPLRAPDGAAFAVGDSTPDVEALPNGGSGTSHAGRRSAERSTPPGVTATALWSRPRADCPEATAPAVEAAPRATGAQRLDRSVRVRTRVGSGAASTACPQSQKAGPVGRSSLCELARTRQDVGTAAVPTACAVRTT
jgi:hypothetical protein